MHPAYSIILFTTASGAGYGMLTGLGLLGVLGLLPDDTALAVATLGPALALVTTGLVASTRHLGHPERAWRAFSQVRTSWLSREGVAAVATYAVAGPFALLWLVDGTAGPGLAGLGLATAVAAAATIACSGMIYASLPPIPDWHNGWTVPVYLALGAMTGALWLGAVAALLGKELPGMTAAAALALVAGLGAKEQAWRHNATRPAVATVGSAIGLGAARPVRLFEAPHTETNYLLREMGYRVGRKHARKLRLMVRVAGFAFPLALTGLHLAGLMAAWALIPAALSATLGVVVERWLFFAEARHTVTLYYGAPAV